MSEQAHIRHSDEDGIHSGVAVSTIASQPEGPHVLPESAPVHAWLSGESGSVLPSKDELPGDVRGEGVQKMDGCSK